MGLFDAIDIAGSGLTAERVRMDVTAENLANAQTTRAANGQPYQRQEVVLRQRGAQSDFGATLAGAISAAPSSASAPEGGVEVSGIVATEFGRFFRLTLLLLIPMIGVLVTLGAGDVWKYGEELLADHAASQRS